MSGLTDKQKEILVWILANRRWTYPTVREIAAHFEKQPSTIQRHLVLLRQKGYLTGEQNNDLHSE